MIEAFETNCLVLKGKESSDLIFEIFGERYWNDTENIFCAPTSELEDSEIEKLEKAGVKHVKAAQFLICEHGWLGDNL